MKLFVLYFEGRAFGIPLNSGIVPLLTDLMQDAIPLDAHYRDGFNWKIDDRNITRRLSLEEVLNEEPEKVTVVQPPNPTDFEDDIPY